MGNADRLKHLEDLRSDIRDEIKRRIEQRDKYSLQLTVTLGALVALAFAREGFERALTAAPLISIYFVVLILYSYRVHHVLARYLREELEPLISDEVKVPLDVEWEYYYYQKRIPGIRRWFFMLTMWVVTGASMAYLFLCKPVEGLSWVALLYVVVCIVVTIVFWKKE